MTLKSYILSDNSNILLGMRLAGIHGKIVKNRDEVLKTLDEVMEDKSIGVIIITENVLSISGTYQPVPSAIIAKTHVIIIPNKMDPFTFLTTKIAVIITPSKANTTGA